MAKRFLIGLFVIVFSACSTQNAKRFIPKIINGSFAHIGAVKSHDELGDIYKEEQSPLLVINNQVYLTPEGCLCNRNAGGDKEGRNSGGDKEGRNSGGDKDGRNAGSDKEGRNSGGDKEGRSFGGDKEGRNSGGDKDGRNAGGDKEGRNSGGDKEGRSFGGDKDGRNMGGDKEGRNAGGDKEGRNSGGDKEGRNASGDILLISCQLKKPCNLKLVNTRENMVIYFFDEFGIRKVEGLEIEIR